VEKSITQPIGEREGRVSIEIRENFWMACESCDLR
jgi:5-methylcytosine-specific restriction endonuclease McrA